jgi:hypothetical protein
MRQPERQITWEISFPRRQTEYVRVCVEYIFPQVSNNFLRSLQLYLITLGCKPQLDDCGILAI